MKIKRMIISLLAIFAICTNVFANEVPDSQSSNEQISSSIVGVSKFYGEEQTTGVVSPIEVQFTEDNFIDSSSSRSRGGNQLEISLTNDFRTRGLSATLTMIHEPSGHVLVYEHDLNSAIIIPNLAIAESYQLQTTITIDGRENIYFNYFTLHDSGRPNLHSYLSPAILIKEEDPTRIVVKYEKESNNSTSAANEIQSNDDIYGTMATSTDVDYYHFVTYVSGSMNIFLHSMASGNNFDFYVYNYSGSTLLASKTTSGNTNELLSLNVQANEGYYIKVVRVAGASSNLGYGLRLKMYPTTSFFRRPVDFNNYAVSAYFDLDPAPYVALDWTGHIGYGGEGAGAAYDYTSPYAYSGHKGVDYQCNQVNVWAARGGTVIQRSNLNDGYGNTIKIDHGNGIVTQYSHLKSYNVNVGAYVQSGSTIAVSGNTGNVGQTPYAYHLHFAVLKNGVYVDPYYLDYLPQTGEAQ